MRTFPPLRAKAPAATSTIAAIALAIGLVAVPSYAADFSIADEDYVAPPAAGNPFQGFYAGGHAGYGKANRHGCGSGFLGSFPADPDCDPLDFDYDQKGWLAGAQTGYNHVFNGGLMVGAEVSASLTGITGNLVGLGPWSGVGDWKYLATATGKVGFAMDRILLYAEGGLGLGGFNYSSAICNFDSTHQGWVAGGGIEATVSPKNTLFVEYNRFDFKGKDASCGGIGGAVFTKSKIDVIKFGFNHFFD